MDRGGENISGYKILIRRETGQTVGSGRGVAGRLRSGDRRSGEWWQGRGGGDGSKKSGGNDDGDGMEVGVEIEMLISTQMFRVGGGDRQGGEMAVGAGGEVGNEGGWSEE